MFLHLNVDGRSPNVSDTAPLHVIVSGDHAKSVISVYVSWNSMKTSVLKINCPFIMFYLIRRRGLLFFLNH